MESIKSFILIIHIIAGATSMITFWVPVAVRKGSSIHNKVGLVYTIAMATVMFTAGVLSLINLHLGYSEIAAFLGYLTVLSGYPLYVGYASVKMKSAITKRYILITKVFLSLLAVGGLGLIVYGYLLGSQGEAILMYVFAALGLLQTRNLFLSTAVLQQRYVWLVEHLRGMMISGIAAHTAFAAFGGRRLFAGVLDGYLMIIPWVLPTVIGVIIIKVMKRKYVPTVPAKGQVVGLAVVGLCIVCMPADAQSYIEQQTRHRFAEMTIGLDLQQHLGMMSPYASLDGVETLDIDGSIVPRLLIGGTHFWGHADFYIAFPLSDPLFTNGDQAVSILSGVETGFKYYPWRIRHGKVRPYVGVTLTDYYYRHTNGLLSAPQGPEVSKVTLPLVAGLNYRMGNHMLEVGISYNHAPSTDYYLSTTVLSEVTLPRLWANVSYKYAFDTTQSAEDSWENGETQRITDILAERGSLDGLFVGVGLSSAWWMTSSPYTVETTPYHLRNAVAIMPDISLGYYWHQPDLDINLAYRGYRQSQRAYDSVQEFGRQSIGIEVKKYLGDYHGFVPFVGPIVSREWLDFSAAAAGRQESFSDSKLAAGLTIGWDIRPNRLQWFTLRTNIRYYPSLRIKPENRADIAFDAIEFNFIQFVFYPGRI